MPALPDVASAPSRPEASAGGLRPQVLEAHSREPSLEIAISAVAAFVALVGRRRAPAVAAAAVGYIHGRLHGMRRREREEENGYIKLNYGST